MRPSIFDRALINYCPCEKKRHNTLLSKIASYRGPAGMNLQQQEGKPFPQKPIPARDRRKHVVEPLTSLSSLGASLPRLSFKAYQVWKQSGLKAMREKIGEKLRARKREIDYRTWVATYGTLTEADRQAIVARIPKLPYQPLVSI